MTICRPKDFLCLAYFCFSLCYRHIGDNTLCFISTHILNTSHVYSGSPHLLQGNIQDIVRAKYKIYLFSKWCKYQVSKDFWATLRDLDSHQEDGQCLPQFQRFLGQWYSCRWRSRIYPQQKLEQKYIHWLFASTVSLILTNISSLILALVHHLPCQHKVGDQVVCPSHYSSVSVKAFSDWPHWCRRSGSQLGSDKFRRQQLGLGTFTTTIQSLKLRR